MKKIILLISLLLMCGCSVKYEVNISSNYTYKEKISFNGLLTDFGGNPTKEFANQYINSFLNNDNVYSFVDKKVDDKNFSFTINGNYKGNRSFLESKALNYLYNSSTISSNESNMVFDLKRSVCSEEDACDFLEFDSIDIIVNSDKVIINSNADETNGKTHIWHLKDSNVKNIYFELTDDTFVNNNIYYIIGAILLIILIVFLIFAIKSKKSNAI